jgi:hypothetical protein
MFSAALEADASARSFVEALIWTLLMALETPDFLSEMVWNTCGQSLRSWQAIGEWAMAGWLAGCDDPMWRHCVMLEQPSSAGT